MPSIKVWPNVSCVSLLMYLLYIFVLTQFLVISAPFFMVNIFDAQPDSELIMIHAWIGDKKVEAMALSKPPYPYMAMMVHSSPCF
jgi:hypothetical protein